METYYSQISSELKNVRIVAKSLSNLSGVFRAKGNEKVSKDLSDMSMELYDSDEKIHKILSSHVDEDVEHAKNMSGAILSLTLQDNLQKATFKGKPFFVNPGIKAITSDQNISPAFREAI